MTQDRSPGIKGEKFSPQWVMTTWSAVSERLFKSVLGFFDGKHYEILIAIVLAGLWTLIRQSSPFPNRLVRFPSFPTIYLYALSDTLFWVYALKFLKWNTSRFYLPAVSLGFFSLLAFHLSGIPISSFVMPGLAWRLMLFAVCVAIFCSLPFLERRGFKATGVTLLLLFFSSIMLWVQFGPTPKEDSFFRMFVPGTITRLLFPMTVLWAEWRLMAVQLPATGVAGILLNPISFCYPIPFGLKTVSPALSTGELRRRELKGIFDLLIGGAILTLINDLDQDGPFGFSVKLNSVLHLLSLGLFSEFNKFIRLFAILRILVGFGRYLGLSLKDPMDFALLAVDPRARWRSWNIYVYEWLRDFVYFPIVVKTRSLFFATVAAFFVSYIFHLPISTFSLGDPDSEVSAIFTARKLALSFSFQALVIYFCLRFPRFWPSASTLKGWLGVIATHLLFALTFLLAKIG